MDYPCINRLYYLYCMDLVPLCLYYCPGKCVSHNLGDLHSSGLIVGLNCRSKTSGQNKDSSSASSSVGHRSSSELRFFFLQTNEEQKFWGLETISAYQWIKGEFVIR